MHDESPDTYRTAALQESLDDTQWEMLGRLTKSLRNYPERMRRVEARCLVNNYYQLQHIRLISDSQLRSEADRFCLENFEKEDLADLKSQIGDTKFRKWKDQKFRDSGNSEFLFWMSDTIHTLEKSTATILGLYAKLWAVGHWMQSICGIGPVISAGLLAHIDITKCKTAGQLWRFAGMDPTSKWEKGEKRPWNAALKTLVAFKCGESFVKVQNRKTDFYGHIFVERKALETERNEAGIFAEHAAEILKAKNWNKTTDAYKAYSEGKLPKAHIHARARRYAVKMFLSHLHHVMYLSHYGTEPPVPFVIEHQPDGANHRHFIEPPNLDQLIGRPLSEMAG